MKAFIRVILLTFFLPVLAASAAQTALLKNVVGATDSVIGAKVVNVERFEKRTKVELHIPNGHLENIDSVVVYRQAPEGESGETIIRKIEYLRGVDKGVDGIRFFVQDIRGFDFRLRLRGDS